ncbi:MAG: DMT family transporter [Erysipelotrichaceae bacterium]|nr:DMT family transporter [Erysipelotrichaceae bacterium]
MNKNKGIQYIILSAFCFALMNTFVKLSGDISSIQKSFFRNLVALIFALIVLKKSNEGIKFKKGNLSYLIIRSVFGTIGILCNFYAIDHLMLSDASMLGKLSPFFTIIFSLLFLKEKMSLFQFVSIIIAFIGSLFIIKPSFSNPALIPSMIGVLGAMGAGAAYTTVRFLGQRGERGPMIVFFFSTFSCLSVVPYLIFNFEPMTLQQIVYLLLAGLAAAGGQFSITAAYSYAPAKDISVYDYSQVIFAAILGLFLFQQIPDYLSIVGYLIIFGISLIMFIKTKSTSSVK